MYYYTERVCVCVPYAACNGNKAAPASHNVFNWVSNYATNAIIASIGLRVRGRRRPKVCITQTCASITARRVIYNTALNWRVLLVKMHAVLFWPTGPQVHLV